MQRFPRLVAGSSSWRLPLPENLAWRIVEALLTDDEDLRTDRFAEAVAEEPVLALWAVCHANRWREDGPRSVAAIAHWLARHAFTVLSWSEEELTQEFAVSQEAEERWAEISVRGVAVARDAATLAQSARAAGAEDDSGDLADRAFVYGLLHGAVEWLSSSGPSVSLSDCEAGSSCLPRWLVRAIRGPAPGPATPLGMVAEACRRLAQNAVGGQRRGGEREPDGKPIESTGRRGRTGSQSPGVWGRLLPQILARLARLAHLETDFARTLEREKLEALRQFAYGASHEINNPLVNISTRAQALLAEETDPERRRKLGTISDQAFRAHEMIADLMLFAKPPEIELGPVDLVALIDRVLGELRPVAKEQGTRLCRTVAEPSIVVAADGGHLAVALKAMCVNSLEAIGVGGQIEISARRVEAPGTDEPSGVEITVSDTGPGIPPEVRRHLFDPFYSGREAGRGLGLGLSKCWRIVTLHGGGIDVDTGSHGGAKFIVRLPAAGDKLQMTSAKLIA